MPSASQSSGVNRSSGATVRIKLRDFRRLVRENLRGEVAENRASRPADPVESRGTVRGATPRSASAARRTAAGQPPVARCSSPFASPSSAPVTRPAAPMSRPSRKPGRSRRAREPVPAPAGARWRTAAPSARRARGGALRRLPAERLEDLQRPRRGRQLVHVVDHEDQVASELRLKRLANRGREPTRTSGSSCSAPGPAVAVTAPATSVRNAGTRNRSASASPRANDARDASSAEAVYHAQFTPHDQADRSVVLPNPAPAITVVSRRSSATASSASSRSRRRSDAGGLGGRSLVVAVAPVPLPAWPRSVVRRPHRPPSHDSPDPSGRPPTTPAPPTRYAGGSSPCGEDARVRQDPRDVLVVARLLVVRELDATADGFPASAHPSGRDLPAASGPHAAARRSSPRSSVRRCQTRRRRRECGEVAPPHCRCSRGALWRRHIVVQNRNVNAPAVARSGLSKTTWYVPGAGRSAPATGSARRTRRRRGCGSWGVTRSPSGGSRHRRDDSGLDLREPRPRAVITTPKFATGLEMRTRKTCSGPASRLDTGAPAGTSGYR